ncbi:hypothetical protein HMPREF9057_03112 [Actinomyces sp. oral taxon 171 str. F0337]|nr:hypothetical protein HMPREF9057_03112 [Actinomyces sp. oral taxon 171 str. F0337]
MAHRCVAVSTPVPHPLSTHGRAPTTPATPCHHPTAPPPLPAEAGPFQ